jgi:class 3 adenylate cyclase
MRRRRLSAKETVMDVEDWLRELSLGQYAAAFLENSVGMDLLPTLTADDLKDLGVSTVGHRRRLLNAIAGLNAKVGPGRDGAKVAPRDAAERRQLSVMFCDISGSTALSTRLDPEDLSALIRAYQTMVKSTITRLGGFIARYVGDGVLIYFGWPEAHETDAERAVQGALAVIAAIAQEPIHGERLTIRIGIATGLVVVGAPIGEGEARQQTAIGETPNLAARLQALAGPNGIVIAESTRRQVGRLFELDDLGPQTLAGFPGTQRAWRVLDQSGPGNRFEALRTHVAPLVARDEELDLLLRRWTRAVSGDGQTVLISGEPGIGKSRLVASLQERLSQDRHVRLQYFCSPQRTDTALYPVMTQLEHAAAIDRNEPPASQCNKLDQLWSAKETSPEDRAFIAALMGLDHADDLLAHYTPQIRKQKTFDALLRQLEALAAQQPILMLFEDVHWSDPTSLELLDRTIERIRRLPVMLVVTFRPEYIAPWVAQPHVTKMCCAAWMHVRA